MARAKSNTKVHQAADAQSEARPAPTSGVQTAARSAPEVKTSQGQEFKLNIQGMNEDLAKVVDLFQSTTGITVRTKIRIEDSRLLSDPKYRAEPGMYVVGINAAAYEKELADIKGSTPEGAAEIGAMQKVLYTKRLVMLLAQAVFIDGKSNEGGNVYSRLGPEFVQIFSSDKKAPEELAAAQANGIAMGNLYNDALTKLFILHVLSSQVELSGPYVGEKTFNDYGNGTKQAFRTGILNALASADTGDIKNHCPSMSTMGEDEANDHLSNWELLTGRYLTSIKGLLENFSSGVLRRVDRGMQRLGVDPDTPQGKPVYRVMFGRAVSEEGTILATAIANTRPDFIAILKDPNILINIYGEIKKRDDSGPGPMFA